MYVLNHDPDLRERDGPKAVVYARQLIASLDRQIAYWEDCQRKAQQAPANPVWAEHCAGRAQGLRDAIAVLRRRGTEMQQTGC